MEAIDRSLGQVFTVVRRSRTWDALAQQRLLEIGVREMHARGGTMILIGRFDCRQIARAIETIDPTLTLEHVTDRSKLPFAVDV